jgi:hypothetical protein
MESTTLLFMVGATTVCVVTALFVRWWYRRQLVAAGAQLEKSERARLYALEQVSHARKQVERLQRELSVSRRPSAAARPLPERTFAPPKLPPPVLNDEQPARQRGPVNGFADTMPM